MTDKPESSLAVRMETVGGWLTKAEPEIAKALKPMKLDAGWFNRVVRSSVLANPKLALCTPHSFMLSIMRAAEMGLAPDGRLAHLVPYGSRAELIVDYKGYIQLAYRHPRVASLLSDAVFDKDKYTYRRGERARIDHEPAPPSAGERTWTTLIATYCVCQVRGGKPVSVWLWKEEIEERRQHSAAFRRNEGPWIEYPIPMAKKTAVREAAKYIPQSSYLMYALGVEDDVEDEAPPGAPRLLHTTTITEVLDKIGEGDLPPEPEAEPQTHAVGGVA